MSEAETNYRQVVKELVLDQEKFARLTLQGKVRGEAVPWRKIVVRPVVIKGQRHLQVSWFTATQDITKNFRGAEAAAQVDEILAVPWSSVRVEGVDEEINVQVTKKGKPIINRSRPSKQQAPELAHNRTKALPLPADKPDQLLQTLDIMDAQGKVRPHMQGKFGQINEFLKLLDHAGELERIDHSPLQILDCGSGSAYLTFAVYHYLNHIRGIPASLIGIDVNEHVVRKSMHRSAELGYDALCFQRSSIVEYQPEVQPDIVLALHACDTATDEAIMQGIRSDASMVVCVPCCHHDLQEQLKSELFKPVLRHGILQQRLGDILTDALRALVLRIMGYRTDVIEFVSSEHTAKNLMIRAVKATAPGDKQFVREYLEMKTFWQVTPHLEQLLGPSFTQFLS